MKFEGGGERKKKKRKRKKGSWAGGQKMGGESESTPYPYLILISTLPFSIQCPQIK